MFRNTPSGGRRTPKAADRAKGWPKLLLEAEGMKVRTKRVMSTGVMDVPAGTVGKLETAGNGWHLLRFISAPCSCCGVAVRVGRVSWMDLEPVL